MGVRGADLVARIRRVSATTDVVDATGVRPRGDKETLQRKRNLFRVPTVSWLYLVLAPIRVASVLAQRPCLP